LKIKQTQSEKQTQNISEEKLQMKKLGLRIITGLKSPLRIG